MMSRICFKIIQAEGMGDRMGMYMEQGWPGVNTSCSWMMDNWSSQHYSLFFYVNFNFSVITRFFKMVLKRTVPN